MLDDFKKELDAEVQDDELVKKMIPSLRAMFGTKGDGDLDMANPM